jgi:hypothetical protein
MTMVNRKTAAGQAKGKKLKVKRETIKDLGSKKSGAVKGGNKPGTETIVCTVNCDPSLVFCRPTR